MRNEHGGKEGRDGASEVRGMRARVRASPYRCSAIEAFGFSFSRSSVDSTRTNEVEPDVDWMMAEVASTISTNWPMMSGTARMRWWGGRAARAEEEEECEIRDTAK